MNKSRIKKTKKLLKINKTLKELRSDKSVHQNHFKKMKGFPKEEPIMDLIKDNEFDCEKINSFDGCFCRKCKDFHKYAEADGSDGMITCWNCRNRY